MWNISHPAVPVTFWIENSQTHPGSEKVYTEKNSAGGKDISF